MVSFFPAPYPDELLYSVIARYHVRSGNTSPKVTLRELFGSTTISAVLDLPCCIDGLVCNLPPIIQFNSDNFIFGHTLFPYYAAFLPKATEEKVLSSMKSSFGGDIHARTGIMASTIQPPRFIRFCPECNKEDKHQFGEYYWHRLHQVPGVLVCYKHIVPLLDSSVSVHGINKHTYIPADENNCNFKLVDQEYSMEFEQLNRLAIDAKWVIDNYSFINDTKNFREKYLSIMKESGLATSTGRVYQSEFLHSFRDYYGDKLLEFLQSGIDYNNQDNWVSSIVRKHRKSFHPLRHLLLIQFLTDSAEKFFNIQHDYKPFGNGPWLCMNAAARHYMKPVVKVLEITHCMDTKLPVGTFKCSCGFVYSRRGPDICSEDRLKIGRIKVFGEVWEKKLQEYVEQEQLSMRETARRLNVDTNTIKKYAFALGLNNSWNLKKSGPDFKDIKESNSCLEVNSFETKRNNYRSKWLDTIENNPELFITDIRKISKGAYIWLYKNDKEWLISNTPRQENCINISNRVDWEARDQKILSQVKKAVSKTLCIDSKPVRLTISRIGKVTGYQALIEKHLDKLPATKEYLSSRAESITEYQNRRVLWATSQLVNNGEELKKWKIIRKAGLRNEELVDVGGVIDNIIRNQNSQYIN